MTVSISGLSELADGYGAIICDIWGVIHDGHQAFAPACEALIRYRERGHPVLLLSNAPRPHPSVRAMLERLSVPDAAYDAILTSGDMTRSYLESQPGARVFHLGPDRDLPLYDALDVVLVPVEQADLIVCTGPFNDETEVAGDYRERCHEWSARRLPMLCANPDIVVERGPRLIPCAGAIAALYSAQGGKVSYFGKPYSEAYRQAVSLLGMIGTNRRCQPAPILAIGDAIATDLKGAALNRIDALFIAGGIHAALAGKPGDIDMKALEAAFAAADVAPRAVIWRLSW